MRRIIVVALFAIMGTVFGMAGVASAQSTSVVEPCPESGNLLFCDPQFGPTGVSGVSGVSGASVSGVSAANLPYTGSSSGTSTLAWIGGGLVLAGGLVVVVTYRRRAASLHS